MTWVKLDDLYDDKRKVKRAWRAWGPNPIGLHVLAITHCHRHRLDGKIPDDWLEEVLPKAAQRTRILATMVENCLFDYEPHPDGGYRVHDFLDWNDSAAERTERAEASRNAARMRWSNA